MSCLKCGKCCDEVGFFVNKERTDVEWLKLHGITVEDRGDEVKITIALPCSKKINNQCSIYDNRPEICKNYRCEKNVLDDLKNLEVND